MNARLALTVLLCVAGGARSVELDSPALRQDVRQAIVAASLESSRDSFGRPVAPPPRPSPFARAIDEAWRKDAAEVNMKAWSEVLVKCQQATNPAWTTALARSEPQQAHCYKY